MALGAPVFSPTFPPIVGFCVEWLLKACLVIPARPPRWERSWHIRAVIWRPCRPLRAAALGPMSTMQRRTWRYAILPLLGTDLRGSVAHYVLTPDHNLHHHHHLDHTGCAHLSTHSFLSSLLLCVCAQMCECLDVHRPRCYCTHGLTACSWRRIICPTPCAAMFSTTRPGTTWGLS